MARHGQSAGNVARDSAEAAGLPVIDIAERDIDVPLSELGRTQATALGHWFGELPPHRRRPGAGGAPGVPGVQTGGTDPAPGQSIAAALGRPQGSVSCNTCGGPSRDTVTPSAAARASTSVHSSRR